MGGNIVVVVIAITITIEIFSPQGQPVNRARSYRALEDILLGISLAIITIDVFPLDTQAKSGPPERQIIGRIQAIVHLIKGISQIDPRIFITTVGIANTSHCPDSITGYILPIALRCIIVQVVITGKGPQI